MRKPKQFLPVPVLAEPTTPTTVPDDAADTCEPVSNPAGRKAAAVGGEARDSNHCHKIGGGTGRKPDSRGGQKL